MVDKISIQPRISIQLKEIQNIDTWRHIMIYLFDYQNINFQNYTKAE